MSTIKYTKDGKKVSVIGKLNNADFIVQEIFVTDDGAEIPAGENFVASGLLDKPAKSWKEDELEKLEKRYNEERADRERQIDRMRKGLNQVHDTLKAECAAARALLKSSCPDVQEQLLQAFARVENFLAGNYTHVFVDQYKPEIKTFAEAVASKEGWRFDGLKLITLLGRTDGSLEWRLHRYSDGSGGSHTEIHPCTSYEDALSIAQASLDDLARMYVAGKINNLNLDHWREIKGIKIPKEAEELCNKVAAENLSKSIDKKKEELEELNKKLRSVAQALKPAKRKS